MTMVFWEKNYKKTLLTEYFEYFIKPVRNLSHSRDLIDWFSEEERSLIWSFIDLSLLDKVWTKDIIEPKHEVWDSSLEWMSLIHSRLDRRDVMYKWFWRVSSIYSEHWFKVIWKILSKFWITDIKQVNTRLKRWNTARVSRISYNLDFSEYSFPASNTSETDESIQLWITIPGIKKLSSKDLRKLWEMFSECIWSNLRSSNKRVKYNWWYVASETKWLIQWYAWDNWFSDDNFFIQDWWDHDDLYINLDNFNFDRFLFISCQVQYFLETWKFINNSDLYRVIFELYWSIVTEWNTLYDIHNTQEYSEFMENIVFPHSEWWTWKKSNILMLGLPWTWKSQMSMKLLTEREYDYEWQKFILDSIVIPLTASDLTSLSSEDSSTRQRIIEIWEKTGKHLLVLIEDIDVALFSQYNNPQAEENEQILTNLLEWIWAFTNVTIISNTNNPYKFPDRLVRGGRFDTFITFYSVKTPEAAEKKIREYINFYSFEWLIDEKDIIYLSNQFVWLTYSSISDFFSKLERKKLFNERLWKKFKISSDLIKETFLKINASKKILETQEQAMESWVRIIQDKTIQDNDRYVL